MDKKVHRRAKTRADVEGKHARRRNIKARDFTHPINIHFSVQFQWIFYYSFHTFLHVWEISRVQSCLITRYVLPKVLADLANSALSLLLLSTLVTSETARSASSSGSRVLGGNSIGLKNHSKWPKLILVKAYVGTT